MENLGTLSPTEALIQVLEDFGQNEPRNVIVLWENDDDVCMVRNNVTHAQAYGMLTLAATTVKDKFLKSWNKQNGE